jgi:hypothetical protein
MKVCDTCGSEVRRIPLLYFQVGKFLLRGNRKAKYYVRCYSLTPRPNTKSNHCTGSDEKNRV